MFERRKAAQEAARTTAARSALTAMIAVAEGHAAPGTPLVLKPGEGAVYRIDGAGLFETRRGAGQWTGRSSGVSVPVGMGVRIRVGQSRGHYVQGAETPTIIDQGTVSFTSRRVAFLGARWTREWDFAKVMGVQHFAGKPWTAIQVSNRQKTSGFTYPGVSPDLVHSWLDLAFSLFQGQRADALVDLRAQLAALDPPGRPACPPGVWAPPSDPASAMPAGWLPDPRGEHRFRWWDGSGWTPAVTD